ncbi:MAG: matrixin family metalloprotease [Deltaproteobacteria bacterium]|nr:matrixin family metalloprotease [Deltaproteobacteria bacterium]
MRSLVVVLVLCASSVARADDASDREAFMTAAPACVESGAHCFGIRLYVARAEDGTTVVTPPWFAAQLALTNKLFEPLDTSFQLTEVQFLDASAARIDDREERTSLAKYMRGQVIDVFLTGYLVDVDKPETFAYGVTWHTENDGRLIIVSGMSRTLTLAHELGHFFGLKHSTYAVSIMNKTRRDTPPPEERRFADQEIAKMKPRLKRLVRSKVLVEIMPRRARI